MKDCNLCQLVSNRSAAIIFEDDSVVLLHSPNIMVPGYLLLTPKQHVWRYQHISAKVHERLTTIARLAMQAVSQFEAVENIYLLSFGEITKHFHYHIFPRYQWMLELDDVYHNNQLDGARLFSEVSKKYTSKSAELEQRIEEAAALIKAGLQAEDAKS